MPSSGVDLLAMSSNRGAAYDIVLLAHVVASIVGFGAVAVAGAYAVACRRAEAPSEALLRYYRPGTNWTGRILFVVPVLGTALVGMSGGSWSFSDSWVLAGLALWASAAVAGEMLLWPAERELQRRLSDGSPPGPEQQALCLRVVVTAAAMLVVFVVSVVVMVAKP